MAAAAMPNTHRHIRPVTLRRLSRRSQSPTKLPFSRRHVSMPVLPGLSAARTPLVLEAEL